MRDYQETRISLERIGEVLESKTEDEDSSSEHDQTAVSGSIRFEEVAFGYDSSPKKILDKITFTIPYGKVTAITGESGSGKTTVLKLLVKFLSPNSGSICIGGNNLQSISPGLWRRQCGVVMQNGFIFSGTIAKNICMSMEELNQDRLRESSRIASLNEFIDSLPLGYNTKVGPKGTGLSQGQRQRILIARAIYKKPDYLFLDEATTALDCKTEAVVLENLTKQFSGKTVVIVTHRLNTIKDVDQIVVMNHGRVLEFGIPDQLRDFQADYFERVKNQIEVDDQGIDKSKK